MSDLILEQEATRAAFSAGIALITLGLGWLVGQRLTSMWTLRHKRRELDFAATTELYRLYGEFFAVWKLWNYFRDAHTKDDPSDVRWSLMQRAAVLEAGFEALLVKVTSERVLDPTTLGDLGLLRQAFQHLRENIRENLPLDWSYSEHPQYLAFKRLSCRFSNLLASSHTWRIPEPEAAASALKEITSNKHEGRWEALRVTNAT